MKRRVRVLLSVLLLLVVVAGSASASPPRHDAPTKFYPVTESAPDVGITGKVMNTLAGRLTTASATETFKVIVQLADDTTADTYTALESRTGPITYTAKWDLALHGFAAELTRPQIEALTSRPEVRSVESDLDVTATLDSSTLYTGARQARADFGVTGSRGHSGYSASNVVVAIIDTGIDATHRDLNGGKVIGWDDEVNHRSTPYDDHGHGSHVSGIVAGTGTGSASYTGYAPGAALVGIKVLNSVGSGSTSGIINGINWMLTNKTRYGVKVANMSLGGSGCSNGTDSLSTAVNNAVSQGITMVVAAGNSGPAACTIAAPAAAQNAITVGAAADPKLVSNKAGWSLAYFSSRGPTRDGRVKPDVVAPGVAISSVKANSGTDYVAMSGTSMATPAVAGIVALMLDANYSLTPAQVKQTLMDTAVDWSVAGTDNDYGAGLVRAYDAIKRAGGFPTGSFSDGTVHSYYSGSLSGTGRHQEWQVTLGSTNRPLAATMIMNCTICDLDLYVYDVGGNIVASSTGTTRQEQVGYLPTGTGPYTVEVYSYMGSGTFRLDVSRAQ